MIRRYWQIWQNQLKLKTKDNLNRLVPLYDFHVYDDILAENSLAHIGHIYVLLPKITDYNQNSIRLDYRGTKRYIWEFRYIKTQEQFIKDINSLWYLSYFAKVKRRHIPDYLVFIVDQKDEDSGKLNIYDIYEYTKNHAIGLDIINNNEVFHERIPKKIEQITNVKKKKRHNGWLYSLLSEDVYKKSNLW